jgi:ribosomal-protein-alanine N-acetyltransferase
MVVRSMPRPITLADLEELAALERACFADPWSRAQLRAALVSEGTLGYALGDGAKIVAYLLGRVVVDQGEILSLATSPAHRRQGLARRLVERALKAMRERGVTTAWLEVRASNAAAQALYHEVGFVAEGVRRGYYRDPVEDALVLRCDLTPGASPGSALR